MELNLTIAEYFLTIDSGINIGIARWNKKTNLYQVPLATFLIKDNLSNWDLHLKMVLWKFEEFLIREKSIVGSCDVYIEKPVFYETEKGLVSARKGSLYKLIKAYVLEQYLLEKHGFKVIEMPANKWKGQMDKKKVDFRIKQIIDQEYPEHISDAVGMGLFVKGIFHVPTKKSK